MPQYCALVALGGTGNFLNSVSGELLPSPVVRGQFTVLTQSRLPWRFARSEYAIVVSDVRVALRTLRQIGHAIAAPDRPGPHRKL